MISVEEARARILAGLTALPAEQVSVAAGLGRVLAGDVVARLTQPSHDVSAMDGYAVRAVDVASVPANLRVVMEIAAGRLPERPIEAGEAARIFTGAALPAGADTIIIQENTSRDGTGGDADQVTITESADSGRYVRPAGLDFRAGKTGITAGRRMTVRDVGLAAAMNVPWLMVHRRPRIAILSTGNEIVMPGEPLAPGQIVSSNSLALAAFVTAHGAEAVLLGNAPDQADALAAMAAAARGCDLLVTSGGASVGKHDLIRSTLGQEGMTLDFWQIAMRPGKPLLFGRLGDLPVLGLPGNPVSTLVCAQVFLAPAIDRLAGLAAGEPATVMARVARDLAANDQRQDYLRTRLESDASGDWLATPFERQDSAMLNRLADADGLLVRPPGAPALQAGDRAPVIRFAGGPLPL
ncbi:MAG: molybdopterin molybdotransferase MoeA [Alphaproteobacteria bacterium]